MSATERTAARIVRVASKREAYDPSRDFTGFPRSAARCRCDGATRWPKIVIAPQQGARLLTFVAATLEPGPVARDALVGPRRRRVVERGARAIDIRVRDRYVARLVRLPVDRRALADDALDDLDELLERDRL